ncbi:MAG: hypothetical protein C0423_19980 [Methylibium sp.]|nr:hypothetical protein [Methylibium sp.]
MSPNLRTAARHLPILLLVLLLHALLLSQLLRWRADARQPPSAAAEPGVLLRLLPLPAVQRPSPADAARARPAGAPARRADTPSAMAAASSPSGIAAAEPAPSATPDTPPATVAATTASGPASAPVPSLLDSEGTRRAIRQASREPLLAERAASASEDPGRLNSQQRLAKGIAAGANGDCLKGEYAGAGMGLLSLPFWVLAEARGKCRR